MKFASKVVKIIGSITTIKIRETHCNETSLSDVVDLELFVIQRFGINIKIFLDRKPL